MWRSEGKEKNYSIQPPTSNYCCHGTLNCCHVELLRCSTNIQGRVRKSKESMKRKFEKWKTKFHLSSTQTKVPSKIRFSKNSCIFLEFCISYLKLKRQTDNWSNYLDAVISIKWKQARRTRGLRCLGQPGAGKEVPWPATKAGLVFPQLLILYSKSCFEFGWFVVSNTHCNVC